MSRHETGFKLTECFKMPKNAWGDRINMTPFVKHERFDRAGVRHIKSRVAGNWKNGRGTNSPQPSF